MAAIRHVPRFKRCPIASTACAGSSSAASPRFSRWAFSSCGAHPVLWRRKPRAQAICLSCCNVRRPAKAQSGSTAPTQPAAAAPVSSPTSSSYKPAAVASAPAADSPGIERDVEESLDGLKDQLFRLELRRQAGTISEEEYARERARTEEILRELVRG